MGQNRHCGCTRIGDMIYCEESQVYVPYYSSCLRGTRFTSRVKFKRLLEELEKENDDTESGRKKLRSILRNADKDKGSDIQKA